MPALSRTAGPFRELSIQIVLTQTARLFTSKHKYRADIHTYLHKMNDNGTPSKSFSIPDLSTEENMDYVSSQRRTCKRSREDLNLDSLLGKYSSGISEQLQIFKVELENKITSLHSDFKADIKCDLDLIKSQLTQVQDIQKKLTAEHLDLVQRTDSIEMNLQSNTSNIAQVNEIITNLQLDLNTLLQRDRLQNLEITGIPLKSNENLNFYVINLAKFVNVNITYQDIEYVTRAQPRTRNSNKPRTIIVKLKTRLLRDTIISGVRAKKTIFTSDIGITSPDPQRVYVNEHLTPANKLLYLQARRKKSTANFKHLWVRDGKIFARKADSSPLIIIRSLNDLDKIA